MLDMANDGRFDFRLRITSLELMTTATDYVTHPIDMFDISQNDMEYRAEGNANIVLALPQRCQVLRLPKMLKRYFLFFLFLLLLTLVSLVPTTWN